MSKSSQKTFEQAMKIFFKNYFLQLETLTFFKLLPFQKLIQLNKLNCFSITLIEG